MSGHEAAAFILREKETLARSITARLYEEKPQLLEKYGERGREKCLEDMHYNLEHLAPAVELGDPGMFASYVRWLDSLLRARNVDTAELVRCLELTETVIGEAMSSPAYQAVQPSLTAGLAELERVS